MRDPNPTLSQGTRLGPYEVEASLGAGGMGEVYRARDTRLGRTVALKVLPDHVTGNPQARARFEREARTASSLSHPNICTLYDVGHDNGIDYIVMEYLEGETLGNRLRRGPLPIEEALRIGAQIADALDAAHRQGLVHRDLKPDNVMHAKAGAKLLDFGLAKTAGELAAASPLTASPTATSPLTAVGTMIGTVGYMSPEQLEGKEADARSDIFGLGIVLYEMVTGQRAFEGSTQASVIASVMKDDPRPISSLQPPTPPALERLVTICLAKDPEQRWQSAGDLKRELQWILDERVSGSGARVGVSPATVPASRFRGRARGLLIGAAVAGWLVAVTALGLLLLGPFRSSDTAPPPVRAEIAAPAHNLEWEFGFDGPVSVSPDGRRIAVVVRERGRGRLWVHDLETGESRFLEGTEGATRPFWSPDSRFIGFFADDKLKKMPASGGVVEALCAVSAGRGGAWSPRGVIVFAPNVYGALHTVPEGGGVPKPLTTAPEGTSHRLPQFLPDGSHFVFFSSRSNQRDARIVVAALDDPEPVELRANLTAGRFALGHLLFEKDGTIFAQTFDSRNFELTGSPVPVADGVRYFPSMGTADFSVSQNGVLVFRESYLREENLEWLDAGGKVLRRLVGLDYFHAYDLSPDGKRLLADIANPRTGEPEPWIVDIATESPKRSVGVDVASATWSPDGDRFAVTTNVEDEIVMVDPAIGVTERLLELDEPTVIADWSSDGRSLVLMQQDSTTGAADSVALELSEDKRIRPLVETADWDWPGPLSPDGRFLVFASDRREPGSSHYELFVTELTEDGGTWQVSSDGAPFGVGGALAAWSRDGKRLYYINGAGALMRVEVDTTHGFRAGTPEPFAPSIVAASFVAVAPDGRVLVLTASEDQPIPPIRVVANWTGLLRK